MYSQQDEMEKENLKSLKLLEILQDNVQNVDMQDQRYIFITKFQKLINDVIVNFPT